MATTDGAMGDPEKDQSEKATTSCDCHTSSDDRVNQDVTRMDRHVCDTEFTDGVWRPVYETPSGRQYVIDAEGEPVFGLWWMPHEECFGAVDRPIIVEPEG